MRWSSGFGLWMSGFDAWRMMMEAQAVIGLRMMGMAGAWTMAEGETARMWTEKQRAFAEAAMDATAAAMAGGSPERVLDAALRPVRRKTRANARRLGRAWARDSLR